MGHLSLTESKYSRVKCEDMCPTSKAWVMQQDSDPSSAANPQQNGEKESKCCSGTSPDLSLVEMLFGNLQRAVHEQTLSNLNEPKR